MATQSSRLSGAGAVFGGTSRFQLLSYLGEGGMGVVYRAYDRERQREVALKTLRHAEGDSIVRFKQEFRALADLEHPNLVHLDELVVENGTWFFTMELVEGQSFLEYVRPGEVSVGIDDGVSFDADTLPPQTLERRGTFDEQRLRHGLRQLARGLHALHQANKIHRDIKPSNLLVGRDGRLVILDFGFATELGAGARVQHSDVNAVGTVDYMAPEQAAARPVGPAADWYSVGVLLYQALTGTLPFSGNLVEIVVDKQTQVPARPGELVPGLPADLEQLCMALLAIAPEQRPSGDEVLRRLGSEVEDSRPLRASGTGAGTPFVGRRHELSVLRHAHAEAKQSGGITVYIEGEPGIGKSALVRHFTQGLVQAEPDTVVLTGRCFERETVPFKAFDGVVDALARYLMRLAPADAAALLPRRAGLLAQVFPVLLRVPSIAKAPRAQHEGTSPQELRTWVFAAFRELLTRLADRRGLVIVIDDLQWADADSLALLAEISRPPDGPHLLLVATVRGAEVGAERPASAPVIAPVPAQARQVRLGALSDGDALELVKRLQPESSGREAGALVAETRGHPLFIEELVRGAARVVNEVRPVRVEQALGHRIGLLPETARELLTYVTLAAGPLAEEAAQAVIGAPASELARLVTQLRAGHFVKSGGPSGGLLEPYHGRVRDAVMAVLDDDARRMAHERLALALEGIASTPADVLAFHWEAAGHRERAGKHAVLAADRAAATLAFQRAADLYGVALSSGVAWSGDERRTILLRRGEALANAGLCRQAAAVFLEAAGLADAAESLELHRRASELYLEAGHLDDGMSTMRHVLDALDIDFPETSAQAVRSVVWGRLRLKLRGLRFTPRDAIDLKQRELVRIDTFRSISTGLAMVDVLRGLAFQTQHVHLALDSGDPLRILRALCLDAPFIAAGGSKAEKQMRRVIDTATAMLASHPNGYAESLLMLTRGIAEYMLGRWKLGQELCAQADVQLRERHQGVMYERAAGDRIHALCLTYLGRYADLARFVPSRVAEAEARGNLFAATNLRTGLANALWLCEDDPARARHETNSAVRRWSNRVYHMHHHWNMLALGQIELYEDQPEKAVELLVERWPRLEGARIPRVQISRIESLHLRARAHLASHARKSSPDHARKALRDARAIAGEKRPWATPLADLVLAGLARVGGDLDTTLRHLDRAVDGARAADMRLYAAIAAARRGALIGGDGGRAAIAECRQLMQGEGVKKPRLFARILTPGFDDLEL